MAKILTNLRIDEVSAVDRGAGEGVKILLMKRNEKMPESALQKFFTNLFSKSAAPISPEVIAKSTAALAQSVNSIMKNGGDDQNKLLAETFVQFQEHLQKAVTGSPPVVKKEVQDMDTAELKKALGLKDDADDAAIMKAIAGQKETLEKARTDKATLEKAAADKEAADKNVDKAAQEKLALEKAAIAALPESVRKQLEEGVVLKAQVEELRKKDMLATFTKKAEDAGLPSSKGELLMKAYGNGGDAAAVDELLTMLKAAHTQVIKAGLFNEFGDGRGGSGTGATAYDELVAKARELRKTDKTISEAQAFAKVFTDPENSDLAKREREESARRINGH
jgi:hypothetical protein